MKILVAAILSEKQTNLACKKFRFRLYKKQKTHGVIWSPVPHTKSPGNEDPLLIRRSRMGQRRGGFSGQLGQQCPGVFFNVNYPMKEMETKTSR